MTFIEIGVNAIEAILGQKMAKIHMLTKVTDDYRVIERRAFKGGMFAEDQSTRRRMWVISSAGLQIVPP